MQVTCEECKGTYEISDIDPVEAAEYFNEGLGDTETTRHISTRCNCALEDGDMCGHINLVEVEV